MDNLVANNDNSVPPPPIPLRPHIEPVLPYQQNYNQISHFPQPFPYQQPYISSSMYNCYQPSSNYPHSASLDAPQYNLLRSAEESSRNAFQSVESVVNAFISVVNMLNSTHSAVFNSFRAVIGVVEQFRVLKHFLISSIAISLIRWIRFIWRRLLAILRLRPRNYASTEQIWANINGNGRAPSNNSFNYATLLFWIVSIGGPIFVYKCIAQITMNAAKSNEWAKGVGEHYRAQALYDFNAAHPEELSLSVYDTLIIAPKWRQPNIKDWLLASNHDGSKIGLVPINYVKLLSKVNGDGENATIN